MIIIYNLLKELKVLLPYTFLVKVSKFTIVSNFLNGKVGMNIDFDFIIEWYTLKLIYDFVEAVDKNFKK